MLLVARAFLGTDGRVAPHLLEPQRSSGRRQTSPALGGPRSPGLRSARGGARFLARDPGR